MAVNDVLDQTYERLHATGPEFEGWLSNHGPMAADALIRLGRADEVDHWVDEYARRLDEEPRPRWAIHEAEWREPLGDPVRLADWCALFGQQVHREPWQGLLARWWPRLLRLPMLAERLPLPTPTPVRIGKPSSLFEHTWTITRWVEGEPADRAPITRIEAAETLAGFLKALHHEAPADAPANPSRGTSLAGLQGVDGWFEVIADYANVDGARKVWERAVAAPAWQGVPLWLHGDLHPANVVVRDGMLVGVIDFGDMCSGDPATDLSAAWILLPAGTASRFFDAYEQADEATITRARGWAVLRALNLIGIGQNGRLGLPGGKPTWEPAGYATLERVLAAN